jgi:uncharacterized RDD family membrane protein YckC
MSSRQPRRAQTGSAGTPTAGPDLEYPGQRLGLPATGSGAIAGFPRRIGALIIDWLICTWAIAQAVLGLDSATAPFASLGIFAVLNLLFVGTFGCTPGMRLMNIRVAALDGGRPRMFPVLVRTVLLCLAIPALIWDRDRRGVHDRVANTLVLRS